MTTRTLFSLLMALLATAAQADPRIQYVVLKPYTSLVVYVPLGGGAKFIFPFVIDKESKNSKDYAPFSSLISNDAFKNVRADNLNSFIVVTDPKGVRDGTHANLFFNVAGYEISVELVATQDRGKHVSDTYFKLGDKAREQLIQDIVAQRTNAMEAAYKLKMDALESDIDKRALSRVGELALAGSETTSVKEEGRGELKNGDRVSVYVAKTHAYGAYTVIPFEVGIDSRTAGAAVRTAMLFAKNTDTNQIRPVDAAVSVPKRVEPSADAKGVVTVLTKELNPRERLQLRVQVEETNIEVEW